MDENAPAFVLELEIDDEVSFKPLKNKRALQTLDSNTIPIATPEKRKQIQKCQSSTPTSSVRGSTPSAGAETPLALVVAASSSCADDDKTPLQMYSCHLENAHKPKYSQAEVDAQKIEWQKESDHRLDEAREVVRREGAMQVQQLEGQSAALRQDKLILERQVAALQSTLFENRSDENSQIDNQVKILSDQLNDAKVQKDLLLKQHTEEICSLKSSNDKRISEMIKSHATSILAMQQRVMGDITATWQQKLKEEEGVSGELRVTVQALSAQVARLGEEKEQAVKDAKKKMYDKVTTQFEAGNAKYEALKSSYKESQESLLTATAKISELKDSLTTVEQELENSRKASVDVAAALSCIGTGCAEIIKLFSSEGLENTDMVQESVRGSIFNRIQNEIKAKASQVEAAAAQSNELNTEIARLKESMLITNKTVTAMNEEKDELALALAAARQAAEATGEELASSKLEKESQMLVIANMITDKGKIDADLEAVTQQNQELTQRCEDLRKMNDEVMSMLEKMYEEKKE
mmetsp:Transcript_19155/g.32063  ORF Transcript_19155/g.32063 Transcript_19155/m.32063 type:complete len:523 (+) Transcript_19155:76-1644(+)